MTIIPIISQGFRVVFGHIYKLLNDDIGDELSAWFFSTFDIFANISVFKFLDNKGVYHFTITINYGLIRSYEYRKSYNDFVFIFKGGICFDITVVLIVSYRMFRKEVIRLSLYFGVPELQYNNCRSARL